MNHQNKFLLPDKSFWQALNRKQRKALVSKYTILCPPILFTEIARHGLSRGNPYLDLENIIVIPHWKYHVRIDLLTEESAKPMFFENATSMKSILERPEEELLEFKEVSGENIEMLQDSEASYKNLDAIIDLLNEEWLNLVNNTDNLSDEEWVDRLKMALREHQIYSPAMEHIKRKIDTDGFTPEIKELLQASIKTVFDTYNADTLENACHIIARLFAYDQNKPSAAHGKLLRLCTVFRSILTEEEHIQIFNRFIDEAMPTVSRFAPYALGVAIWNFTIQLYLRENPDGTTPPNVLRDAQYLYYTAYNNITFVSADKWHKIFVNEVPLFEGVHENFVFVDLTTKTTIQEGLSKLL